MMEKEVTYCFCGRPYDPDLFMIQCDACKEWYHGDCIGVTEYMINDIEKFHCSQCEGREGPSIKKQRLNWHRHDYTELDAHEKPVQNGTEVFIRELETRHFAEADEIVKRLTGEQLTVQYLQTNGFENPIIIDEKEGLGMVVPSPSFTVHDVEKNIGGQVEYIDVIDVTRQDNVRIKLSEFIQYYTSTSRASTLNVISLEFTDTGLAPMVEAPSVARKLDWVNSVWPSDWPEGHDIKRPKVQKYCLMGVENSYTDFHIDFGGTSVWYHVLRGEKVFYLIKPTPANLQVYQQWMCSMTQSETFLGDQVDTCYKCVIKEGQTMMIPNGWIHAVLTPVDSLVFGGNFLHSLNIPMQIQIYELEKKLKTPEKFQYPKFETINWFAADKLLNELQSLNSEGKECPEYLLQGTKALLAILKQWNTDKDYSMLSRVQIPETINSQKLLKEFSKEIRHAERYLISLNPPKPERESTRKRKKPLNKDFVDFYFSPSKTTDNSSKATLKETNKVEATVEASSSPNRPPLKMTLPKSVASPGIKSVIVEKSTVSNKQSPTLIRIKLGNDEVVRRTNDNIDVYNNVITDHSLQTTKESLTWKPTSVYDFHDGSNESDYDKFVIDESQKSRKRSPRSTAQKKFKCDYDGNVDVLNDEVPKNGIEELLKASVYTLGNGAQRIDVTPSATTVPQYTQDAPPPTGSGRASPSTREAIAGMLSFSEQCYSTTSSTTKSPKSTKTQRSHVDDDDQSIENIDKVHQDDDFIYPALDASDDEDYTFKPKAKSQIDEAWNPKARVGPLLPKTNRPAREGVKRTSVEKGLEAAAAKRAKESDEYLDNNMDKITKKRLNPTKRTYNKRKQKDLADTAAATSTAASEDVANSSPRYGSVLTIANRLQTVKAKLAAPVPGERKPKKGLKTPKQRLGKILKIHRMTH